MKKEELDIVIQATDDASPTFRAIESAAEDLGDTLGNVGDEGTDGMDELGDGADKAEDDVRKLGDEARETGEEVEDLGNKSKDSGATMQLAFQNIADGVMRAKEGVVELGRNLMDALDLAGQQEQQETFLKMNIGAEGAAKQMKIINDLVAELPGDDVAIGGLLSQAAAKNAKISADELKRMGDNAADYFAAMNNYGKSSIEAQQDLTNYILTGNTAELERSPVLQAHIDKLKQATTVEERNLALQEALTEEGWAGIGAQDTYNNKLQTFTATLDRGKRQLGEMFLGAASGAMDFIGDLDQATGGVLAMGIALGSVAGGPMIDMITGVGQMATGLKALQTAFEGTAIATAIAEQGFWSAAAAELAALWPILAIIAALTLVAVAVYEVGKAFGWWTDVSSMLDAVWAGIQRLWSAFINHPDVQGFIKGVSDAWAALQPYVQAVVNAVMSFFNVSNESDFDLVRTLIDTISFAWDAMTLPIKTVIKVVKLLWSAFSTMYTKCKEALDKIKEKFNNFKEKVKEIVNKVKDKIKSITDIDLSELTSKITQPVADAYDKVKKTVEKIKNKIKEIPSNVGSASLGPLGALLNMGFDYEGMLEAQSGGGKSSMDINLNVDLRNVPQGVNTETLIAVLTDPAVLQALTGNSDFQSYDAKAKNRLALKQARARGAI